MNRTSPNDSRPDLQNNSTLTVGNRWKICHSWASGLANVIPGSIDKRPLVKFAHLHYNKAIGQDITDWRRLAILAEGGANGLLLLDAPSSALCCVDVDDLGKLPQVLKWFVLLGFKQTLRVESGREGGGCHYYFRREAGKERQYHSLNGVPKFGNFLGKDGKEHGSVDFKAHGSYMVCPGSMHKSGLIYKAFWDKEEIESLDEILDRIPVMPLEAWNAARNEGKDGVEADGVEWVVSGPEWEQVLRAHRRNNEKYQVCPWCLSRGSKSAEKGLKKLQFFPGTGTAHCYREGITRKIRMAEDQKALREKLLREILESVPEGVDHDDCLSTFSSDPIGWARDNMQNILNEELFPKDSELPALFPDGDPLKEWPNQAAYASALAERAGFLHRREVCTKGPWAMTATGKSQERLRLPCGKWHCPDCGPVKLQSFRLSVPACIAAEQDMFLAGLSKAVGREANLAPTEVEPTVSQSVILPYIGSNSIYTVGLRTPSTVSQNGVLPYIGSNSIYTVERRTPLAFNSTAWAPRSWNTLSVALNRWASKAAGRGWLATRPSPGIVTVIAWAFDSEDNEKALASWPLAQGAVTGSIREVTASALDEVSLQDWCSWREKELQNRLAVGDDRAVSIELILAPSKEKTKISKISNYLLGWDLGPGSSSARGHVFGGTMAAFKSKPDDMPPRPKPDPNEFHYLVTYKSARVDEEMGLILQETIKREEAGVGMIRVVLPCAAAPLQKEIVDRIPDLHAHAGSSKSRKAKRAGTQQSSDALNDLLLSQ